MYEMKGALCGTPPRLDWLAAKQFQFPLVSQHHRSRLAAFQPHRSGSAGFPASPFQLGRFPSLAVPTRPASQLHRFQFGWSPASPVRAVRLPVRPGATRRPASAKHLRKIPVSRPFPRPGGSPRMVPVPCGECISTPSASVTQEPAGIHFEFFPRPHVVHRIPPVIRTFQRLSTGFCTAHPQVTRRNSSPWRQADLRPNRMEAASTPSGPSAPCRPRSQAGRWHIGPVLAGPTAHRPSPARSHRARNAPGNTIAPSG